MRQGIRENKRLQIKTLKPTRSSFFSEEIELDVLFQDANPFKAIASGKLMARAWAKSLAGHEDHLRYSHTFLYYILDSYWKEVHGHKAAKTIPKLPHNLKLLDLDTSVYSLAKALGYAASKLDVIEASYYLGNIYTATLPDGFRSGNGIFYTPPCLTNRLLNMVEEAGTNWATVKVVDPACGGGAFLAPVALKMAKALEKEAPITIIKHIENSLIGYDNDPFGAWLTQLFLEVALKDIIEAAQVRIITIVKITNSLEMDLPKEKFDLVIGNPPYGKVKLNSGLREKFRDSLFGHANYYGLFTDLALKLVKDDGVIGFLTPTSFLSGEYFKNLRSMIRRDANVCEMDFVLQRKGVFEDVLQETILTTYKKTKEVNDTIRVNGIDPKNNKDLEVKHIGVFGLPKSMTDPWILARTVPQATLVKAMLKMKYTLKDWGYKVSTGPLVWNRHKEKLSKKKTATGLPVIWAESITQDGNFFWKAEKKNHQPYFKISNEDEGLITKKPCILLQRTTAKEQHKRLIAAPLPFELIEAHGGVVIENHINMIIQVNEKSSVSTILLAAFLNSKAVNDAFRCISGSVAVSAFELESLPLPSPASLVRLKKLIKEGSGQEEIELECMKIYSSR